MAPPKLSGLLDQAWMEVEEHLDDIKRLAETGLPASDRDVCVIRKCLTLMAADILTRRGDRAT